MKKEILLLPLITLLISSCGSGEENQTNTQIKPPKIENKKPLFLSGYVIDPPIIGAKVFIDLNKNGQLDPNEPFSKDLSSQDGYYSIDITNITLPSSYDVVSMGGTHKNEAFNISLKRRLFISNPSENLVANLNPASTLISELISQGNSSSQATLELKKIAPDISDLDATDEANQLYFEALHVAITKKAKDKKDPYKIVAKNIDSSHLHESFKEEYKKLIFKNEPEINKPEINNPQINKPQIDQEALNQARKKADEILQKARDLIKSPNLQADNLALIEEKIDILSMLKTQNNIQIMLKNADDLHLLVEEISNSQKNLSQMKIVAKEAIEKAKQELNNKAISEKEKSEINAQIAKLQNQNLSLEEIKKLTNSLNELIIKALRVDESLILEAQKKADEGINFAKANLSQQAISEKEKSEINSCILKLQTAKSTNNIQNLEQISLELKNLVSEALKVDEQAQKEHEKPQTQNPTYAPSYESLKDDKKDFQSLQCAHDISDDSPTTDLIFEVKGINNKTKGKLNIQTTFYYPNPYTTAQTSYISDVAKNGTTCVSVYGPLANMDKDKFPKGYGFSIEVLNNGVVNDTKTCTFSQTKGFTYRKSKHVIKVDCTTSFQIKDPINETLQMDEHEIFHLPKPKFINNNKIANLELNYKSLSPNVSVDKYGQVTVNQTADLSKMAQISVQADPNLYDSQSHVYNIQITPHSKPGLKIRALEIGQSSMLPIGGRWQVIAPENGTIIRALVYKNANFSFSDPKVFIDDKEFKLNCPSNVGEFNADLGDYTHEKEINYKLSNTCYLLLDSQEAKILKPGIVMKFDFGNGLIRYATPKVIPPTKLNLVILKAQNSDTKEYATAYAEDKIIRHLKQIFPLSHVNIETKKLNRWSNNLEVFLKIVGDVQAKEDPHRTKTYAGFLPVTNCVSVANGYAYIGNPYLAVVDSGECDRFRGNDYILRNSFPHELGHTFGLEHSPCNTSDHHESWWDTSKAWHGVERGFLSNSPIVMFPQDKSKLVDIDRAIRKPGTDEADLMGYCGNRPRMSKHNYEKIANFFLHHERNLHRLSADEFLSLNHVLQRNANQTQKAQNMPNTKVLSGQIEDEKITIEPISLSPLSNVSLGSFTPSEYKVLIKTDKNTYSYEIAFQKLDHGESKIFNLALKQIPLHEKILSLQFYKNQTKLPYFMEDQAQYRPKSLDDDHRNLKLKLSNKFAILDDYTLMWRDDIFAYAQIIFISKTNERKLLKLKATSGIYHVDKLLGKGKLEITLQDGLNNEIIYLDLL